ncbi:MAG TPA: universal stress protein [Legionella sp.]|nr:universal stress protein [Legionella sp.]
MKRFRKILFVSHGINEESGALEQAIRLALDNNAELSILIISPDFPERLKEYESSYVTWLKEQMDARVAKAKSTLKSDQKKIPIIMDIEFGYAPDVRIIKYLLKHQHDLLIKEIEPNLKCKGFKSLDMELLRKCPSALFLHRPLKNTSRKAQVAVAIDANDVDLTGQKLAVKLLELSHSLATRYSGNLNIITCWDFPMEDYLRQSLWVKISDNEVDNMVSNVKHEHGLSLRHLIAEAKIGENYSIAYLKGNPTTLIPKAATEKEIDILVMGTLARTGITGFIIGNTAEDILQEIDCSLLALKPEGFISPVKID